jgi:hypothetical protein
MNAAVGEKFRGDDEDFDKLMYGVQRLLDSRVLDAIKAAEMFRVARSNASGGVIDRLSSDVVVHAGQYAKLTLLRNAVRKLPTGLLDECHMKGLDIGLLEDE